MGGREDPAIVEVEWIDLAPDTGGDALETGTGPRWPYVLGASVLLAAVIAGFVHRGTDAPRSAAASSSAPSLAASRTVAAIPPGVVSTGHSILDVPDTWDLYARAVGTIVRIELEAGRITRTTLPALDSSGPVSFLAGPSGAIIRPIDGVAGYLVPDGGKPARLQGQLAVTGPALPSTIADHYWVPLADGELTLVDSTGFITGTTLSLPADDGLIEPDGGGYPLSETADGTYSVRPNGVRRVTGGTLVAVGPTTWLAVECDLSSGCATKQIDQESETVRSVHIVGADQWTPNGGVVSPDATVAALLRPGGTDGVATLHIVDLVTGTNLDTKIAIDIDTARGPAVLAWSPDSQWLFVVEQSGRLAALGAIHRPDPGSRRARQFQSARPPDVLSATTRAPYS